MMNQSSMTNSDYDKLRRFIVRCMVKDIRDGSTGVLNNDAKSIYRRFITLIIQDNIEYINEQHSQMKTADGESPERLTVNDVVKLFS